MIKKTVQLPIDAIITTEREFEPLNNAEMEELADSIAKVGILQPLVVLQNNGGYELCAGYNRLNAAKMVGLKDVPVVVIDHPVEAIYAKFDTDVYRRHLTTDEKIFYVTKKDKKKDSAFVNLLIPEFLERYKNNEMTYSEAKTLSSLSIEKQRSLLDMANEAKAEEQIAEYNKKISEYEDRITELSSQIEEIKKAEVERGLDAKKLEALYKKRVQEEIAKIRDEYAEQYKSDKKGIDEMINEEKRKIGSQYAEEIKSLNEKLIDMSKAKAEAQKHIDEAKELVAKAVREKKEIEIIATKNKNDIAFMKETIRKMADGDAIVRRFHEAISSIKKACDTMVIIGIEGVRPQQSEIIKCLGTLSDQIHEIRDYFKNDGK